MRRHVLLLCAAVVLSGCAGSSGEDEPTATPFPSGTSAGTPTESPTPTRTLSPEEQQQAAAIAAVTAYWDVVNGLSQDPGRSLDEIPDVAFDPARTERIDQLRGVRRNGQRAEGDASLDSLSARMVEGGVEVSGCVDLSSVSVLGPNGEVVLAAADRDPPRVSTRWLVVYEDDYDGWFVAEEDVIFADATANKVKPC